MPQSYEIPLGIDASEIIKGLDQIDNKIVELAKDAELSQKAMRTMFDGALTGDEMLLKKLNQTSAAANQLGTDLKKALDNGLNSGNIEKRFSVIAKALDNVTKGGKISLNIDTAKLAALEALLASTKDEAAQLGHVLEFAGGVLNTLDPNSEEFRALGDTIVFLNATLEEYNAEMANTEQGNFDLAQSFDEVYGELKPVSNRLAEIEDRLHQMFFEGQNNTQEFKELSKEAVRLKTAIQTVDNSIDVFAKKTAKLDILIEAATGLAGAFAAVQGATALFGDESEELNETIAKTQGAIALLQGAQQVMALLNSDSAIGAYLLARAETAKAAATATATGATVAETAATVGLIGTLRGLYATMLANPITAFIALITAAATAVYYFALQNKEARKELDNLLQSADNNKFLTEQDIKGLERNAELERAILERRGGTIEEQAKLEGFYANKTIELRLKALNDARDIENKIPQNREATNEQLKEAQQASIEAEENYNDAINNAKIKAQEIQKKRDEEAKAQREKVLAEERKAYDERKKLSDLILQLSREVRDIEIGLIEDEFEQRRAAVNNNARVRSEDLDDQRKDLQKAFELRIEDAKKNGTYSKDLIAQERKLLLEAAQGRNELQAAVEKERLNELKKIDAEQQQLLADLRANALQLLADFYEEGGEREARLIKINFDARRKEINEAYKNDNDTRIALLKALGEKENAEIVKLKLDNDTNKIRVEEETQNLIIDILELGSSRSVQIEREAAAERLKIKLEATEKELAALELAGVKENDTRVLQLQKTKLELQKGLKELGQEPASIFTLLGLDDNFSGEEQTKITDGLSAFYQNLQNISSEINAMYQRRIDKHKEVISEYEKDIDDLDGLIDKENEAKLRGDANNLAALEAERATIEAARQKELEEVEKYQKKQQALQRVQLIADTAIGTSNLIVASTNVFKSLSPIPFVGVPLAIGLIATMFGSFAAAKINAFKELQDIPKFRKGGLLEGASHENGGAKFYSKDGNGFELEGKEYITNAESTRLNMPLLELINNDGRNPILREIQEILENGEGFKSSRGLITEGAKIIKMNEGINNDKTIIIKDNATLENKIDTLIELKRADVQAYEDNEYFYIKKGKELTKVKKEKRA